jgi:hypothetical protein
MQQRVQMLSTEEYARLLSNVINVECNKSTVTFGYTVEAVMSLKTVINNMHVRVRYIRLLHSVIIAEDRLHR